MVDIPKTQQTKPIFKLHKMDSSYQIAAIGNPFIPKNNAPASKFLHRARDTYIC